MATANPERLVSDAPVQPPRATSDDVPAALLQQIVALPKMAEDEAIPPAAVAESSPTATNPMRLRPIARAAKADSSAAVGDAAYAPVEDAAVVGPTEGAAVSRSAEPGRSAAPSIAGLMRKGVAGSEGGQAGLGPVASATPLGIKLPARGSAEDIPRALPEAYRLRVAPDRVGVAERHGGTAETEAAVKAALNWLAESQASDGHWDPRAYGAGKENHVLGQDRRNAGSNADTGMTGLALLGLLASGHTHLDGPYRQQVRRGLEYLMRVQASNGSLSGQAALFEAMYCHAMATCSLSEAFGMTRDARLQNRSAGPSPSRFQHRMSPVAAGDIAPASPATRAKWAGSSCRLRAPSWRASPCRSEPGRASFDICRVFRRANKGAGLRIAPANRPPAPSSAEAMVCWQFLGLAHDHPACGETGEYLSDDLPGQGEYNLYYWYYGTLAMYQFQGATWQRWNAALQSALLSRQVKDGPLAGSWSPDDLWGGHGGRIYSTAMATLMLEVYYRFLPLYAGASDEDRAK